MASPASGHSPEALGLEPAKPQPPASRFSGSPHRASSRSCRTSHFTKDGEALLDYELEEWRWPENADCPACGSASSLLFAPGARLMGTVRGEEGLTASTTAVWKRPETRNVKISFHIVVTRWLPAPCPAPARPGRGSVGDTQALHTREGSHRGRAAALHMPGSGPFGAVRLGDALPLEPWCSRTTLGHFMCFGGWEVTGKHFCISLLTRNLFSAPFS